MTSPLRPPEAPDWIAAPRPGSQAAPAAGPLEPPPAAAAPSKPATSNKLIAGLVALGLVGALGGGVLMRAVTSPKTEAATNVVITPAPAPFAGRSPLPVAPSAPSQQATTDVDLPDGIVDIDTTSTITGLRGAGTGMVLTSNGDVLTNNHVVEGATSIVVTLTESGTRYNATVVGTDPADDVALIHLTNASGLDVIPLGDSSDVDLGDSIVAAGNAYGRGGTPTVVTGTVQGLNETITVADEVSDGTATLHGLIGTNAALVPGESGGPMLDENGKVIGMNTAGAATNRRSGGAGYAVPINTALRVVEQIRSGEETDTIHIGVRGFLGVATTDGQGGALVREVTANGPADKAGLVAGDVITAVDGQSVASAEALTDLVHNHQPGDTIRLTWTTASGETQSASVVLATGAPD